MQFFPKINFLVGLVHFEETPSSVLVIVVIVVVGEQKTYLLFLVVVSFCCFYCFGVGFCCLVSLVVFFGICNRPGWLFTSL